MAKQLLSIFICLISFQTIAQNNKEPKISKGQEIESPGRLRIFNYYGGSLESGILEPNNVYYRVVQTEGVINYYLRIEQFINSKEYSTNIPYEEIELFLLQIASLREEFEKKVGFSASYGFNSFIAPSGCEVGYIISESIPHFYIKTTNGNLLENYMKLKNGKELEEGFRIAKQELERIKNQ